jgi:hypothetical protein
MFEFDSDMPAPQFGAESSLSAKIRAGSRFKRFRKMFPRTDAGTRNPGLMTTETRFSLEPSTGLYPEPDESRPYHSILSLYDPPNYVKIFLVAFLLLAFRPKSHTNFSFPTPNTCLAHLILVNSIVLIVPGNEYKLRSSIS